MEIIPGDRGNVYVNNNFVYRLNKFVNGVMYLRCSLSNCHSRATVSAGDVANFVFTDHSHEPDEVAVELLHLKNELKAQAATDQRPPRAIFDDVSRRFPRAAVRLGFPGIRSTLYKYRQQRKPPIPQSLAEFANTLLGEQWRHLRQTLGADEEPFFRGTVGGEAEGWAAAVYVSPRLRNALSNTSRLHMDGTFKVLPNQLNAYQLLTIHGEFMNHLFPVAFAIMTRKSQEAYQGVFNFIQPLLSEWHPQVILTDFELAMSNAAHLVWPNARTVGCFFHFAQAVHRMHMQLRMHRLIDTNLEAGKTLQMLMALALLPADRIPQGIRVVKHYTEVHGLAARFQVLLRYMDNFWLRVVGANRLSVFGEAHRTNNALEAFHSNLLRTMGPHPGVWEFHENIRRIEDAQWLDYSRMANGVQHVRPRRRAYVRQDAAIHQASTMLLEGRYNEAQFLNRMSHCTLSLAHRLRAGRGRPVAEQPAPANADPGNVGRQLAAEPTMPPPLPAAAPVPPPAPPVNEPAEEDGAPVARQAGVCVVCINTPATHVVVPCGHLCVCEDCAQSLRDYNQADRCPTCRAPGLGLFRVYIN